MTWDEVKESLEPFEGPLLEFYKDTVFGLVPSNAQVLEIGSGWGMFSRSALEAKVDIFVTTIDAREILLPMFHANTLGFADRLKIITGDSKVEVPKLISEFYDFVFVDADHGYEGVLADARNVWSKLKVGGYILFDDVFHKNNWKPNVVTKSEDGKSLNVTFDYGVTRAVFQFFKENQIENFQGFSLCNGLILIQKK